MMEPPVESVTVQLRVARLADLAQIQQCASLAYQGYVSRIGRKPAPMVADFKTQIEQGNVTVITSRERLAGYVVFYLQDDSVHLENVAVLPELMGQGIGRRLIEEAESLARRSGVNLVELYTNEAMIENLSLYPMLGYTETGRKTEDGFRRVYFNKHV